MRGLPWSQAGFQGKWQLRRLQESLHHRPEGSLLLSGPRLILAGHPPLQKQLLLQEDSSLSQLRPPPTHLPGYPPQITPSIIMKSMVLSKEQKIKRRIT
ncbi:UNVERIFIED_CONTAM: hypothetical protein Slati_4048300 [Sesamum latifolium]|uniref:Uncharacterized protein n=1 Tax=Sesamum latifolium TaxID=2727402 RepID=A0AAW2TSA9_9LAMI